jgi:hypothetical protein
MMCSVISRWIRHLVVLCSVALYAGDAVGQAAAQCPNLPAARAPAFHVAAEQTQVEPTALETPIWKTITVGGSKGVNATRDALETAPCHMTIADDEWHRDFYASLRRNDGQGPCCSLTDCRPTQSRMVGDHYEVKLDGEWMQVPNWTIINVVAFHTNVNWLASIRGRLGYV